MYCAFFTRQTLVLAVEGHGLTMAATAVPTIFRDCSNCGQAILASNLLLHEAHCERNLRRCPHCSEIVAIRQYDEHRTERTRDLPQLLAALERGDAEEVRSIVAHGEGAHATWCDEKQRSALQLAITMRASTALVLQLLQTNTRDALLHHCDDLGRTALHCAAQAGSIPVVDALLAAGAEVHAQTAVGATPMTLASHEDVRLQLAKAGAALRASGGGALLPQPPPRPPPDRMMSRASNFVSSWTSSRASSRPGSRGSCGSERRSSPSPASAEPTGEGLQASSSGAAPPIGMGAAAPNDAPAPAPPRVRRRPSHVERLRAAVESVQLESGG